MDQIKVLVASSKGGTGKTTTALALTAHWAEKFEHVYLLDADAQDSFSACWLLRRADRAGELPAGIDYSKVSPAGALAALRAPTDLLAQAAVIVVDTPPRLGDDDLRKLARLVDVVLVPGSLWEAPTIVQTARTLRGDGATNVRPVLTRTSAAELRSADGAKALAFIEREAGEILGTIAGSSVVSRAMLVGQLPTAVRARERRRLRISVGDLAGKLLGRGDA